LNSNCTFCTFNATVIANIIQQWHLEIFCVVTSAMKDSRLVWWPAIWANCKIPIFFSIFRVEYLGNQPLLVFQPIETLDQDYFNYIIFKFQPNRLGAIFHMFCARSFQPQISIVLVVPKDVTLPSLNADWTPSTSSYRVLSPVGFNVISRCH